MTEAIYSWSKTAADNDDADTIINWQELQDPDTVNNSARAMMQRHAEYLEDVADISLSTGAADAYEVTAGSSPASLTGLTIAVAFRAHQENTGAATFKLNAFAAKPLRIQSGVNLVAAAIKSGSIVVAYYNETADEFLAITPGTGIAAVVGDTTPQLGGMLDVNGQSIGDGTLELLKFVETASAVNELTITNAATGVSPALSATGDDADISLSLTPKGSGVVLITSGVGGSAFLDDDTFATATATTFSSSESIKAYVDAETAAATADADNYTQLAEQVTTSGTLFDFTIPSGATEVKVLLKGNSLSGTDNLLVQLGDSGGIEGTGYSNYVFTSSVNITNGSGFPTFGGAAANAHLGIMTLHRASVDGSVWVMSHGGTAGVAGIGGGGFKALSAELTTVRLTRTGTDTFDAGSVIVSYTD